MVGQQLPDFCSPNFGVEGSILKGSEGQEAIVPIKALAYPRTLFPITPLLNIQVFSTPREK